ncbi:gluconate 2-dehydrogenase subunit 3 family protein [Portibacter marinus]|uniref:gluconate 2-dehydrogenase subunit 3 family protein n=1 Tax=Portibacter marinus TaxID=2898660 RepID=UPI001F249C7F|nr:gluconate 2-dehydrogenase subunit 3 family protein [Portibacter marinus]
MNRREVLKTAGLVLGYTITAGSAAAILGGCSADPTPNWTPETLKDDQVKTLEKIANAIVPGTDQLPGAKDVNIAKFMDERLSIYATEEEKTAFQEGYSSFVENHKVTGMSDQEILDLVKSEIENGSDFMKAVHEQSIIGFCTSERGMKEVLVFKPIPSEQKGCVPLEEVGGIWAI